jgi:hypothetical protein
MKKLSLNLDALELETFHLTSAKTDEGGTVYGHVSRQVDGCLATVLTCPAGSGTDWSACNSTCEITCGDTCDNFSCLRTCVASCGCTADQTICHYTCCSDPC